MSINLRIVVLSILLLQLIPLRSQEYTDVAIGTDHHINAQLIMSVPKTDNYIIDCDSDNVYAVAFVVSVTFNVDDSSFVDFSRIKKVNVEYAWIQDTLTREMYYFKWESDKMIYSKTSCMMSKRNIKRIKSYIKNKIKRSKYEYRCNVKWKTLDFPFVLGHMYGELISNHAISEPIRMKYYSPREKRKNHK